MRVIGLDLSITGTGIAGCSGQAVWFTKVGSPTPKVKPVDAWRDVYRRKEVVAGLLFNAVEEHLQGNPVDLWVIEQPAMNQKQAAHMLYAIFWEVYGTLQHWQAKVALVPATTLKAYALGYADKKRKKGDPPAPPKDKEAMLQAATRSFPQLTANYDNNVADALWLMAMGAQHLGEPVVKVPAGHLVAMGKVVWPSQ